MRFRWHALLLLLWLSGVPGARGGGSGLNVVLVMNQNSSNSVALGNYYRELRDIPPQNVLRIAWGGGNIEWTSTDFNSVLLNPLLGMVKSRGLTNQATTVLLSMDIPYRIVQNGTATTSGINSTTSVLFYGFKPDYPPSSSMASCSLPNSSSNSYAGNELAFADAPPSTANTNSFMAFMLTAADLTSACQIATRAALSDRSAPGLPFVLGKSGDRLRNVRYLSFDDALFDLRFVPGVSGYQTNLDDPAMLPGPVMGYQNGRQSTSIVPNIFGPGAMADDLTSYGGALFEDTGQTSALEHLAGGAAGSYGTVVEPCNYLEKFPSPRVFFYQARGFSLAECYYMGVTNPYQGLLVGEPLAAPFATRPQAAWVNLPVNASLSGTTNLALMAIGFDASRPVGAADLFMDGQFFQSLTNLAPRQNNTVSVTLRGYSTSYVVPANATLRSVATALTAQLNNSTYSSSSKVRAYAHGDRIELRGTDITKTGIQIGVSVNSSIGTAALKTVGITNAGVTLADSLARGLRSYVITNAPKVGDYLELLVTKTNGQVFSVAVTNVAPGTNLYGLASSLFAAVNNHVALSAADGLVFEDINMHEEEPYRTYVYGVNDHSGEFNLRSRGPGWPASQIQVTLRGSATFKITPSGSQHLDENVADLRPRQHLYLTSGLDSLAFSFPLNTTAMPDGTHELRAVFYEGSHVRAQGHAVTTVRVQNTPLNAALTLLTGASTADLSATLQFAVAASGATISKIELFSTGGALTNVTGQSTATLLIPGSRLGPGLHPFYAVVTAASGATFRTAPQWVRLLGSEPPFSLSISGPPPGLSWNATAGRTYEMLSSTNVSGPFVLRDTVVPSNCFGFWLDKAAAEERRFYRVRTAN